MLQSLFPELSEREKQLRKMFLTGKTNRTSPQKGKGGHNDATAPLFPRISDGFSFKIKNETEIKL